MKAKCIVDEPHLLTKDKVYDVIRIDEDGLYWVIGGTGEEYFMCPDECEVVEE